VVDFVLITCEASGSGPNIKNKTKKETDGDLLDRKKRGSVTTEAEFGVMWPQVKEC
jgi:hypothetical protein